MNDVIDRFVGQNAIPFNLRPALRDAMRTVADIATHREREKAIKFCASTPLAGAELATALARSLHASPQRQDGADAGTVKGAT